MKLTKELFDLDQTVLVQENVEPMFYLLGQIAVTTAVKELAHSMRKQFLKEMMDRCLRHGSAVSVYGVHLK